jgi:hypothetical protein
LREQVVGGEVFQAGQWHLVPVGGAGPRGRINDTRNAQGHRTAPGAARTAVRSGSYALGTGHRHDLSLEHRLKTRAVDVAEPLKLRTSTLAMEVGFTEREHRCLRPREVCADHQRLRQAVRLEARSSGPTATPLWPKTTTLAAGHAPGVS